MRKIRCKVLLLVAMSCLLLTGCGGSLRLDKEGKATLKKYSEWAKAIGLTDERKQLQRFEEAENSLLVCASVSYQELAEFAERTMRFTEEHPDYFPAETQFIIGGGTMGRNVPWFAFSNKVFPSEWKEEPGMVCIPAEIEEMLRSYENGSICYLFDESGALTYQSERMKGVEIGFPVTVVFLYFDDGMSAETQEKWNLDYLTQIQGLQCVVINLSSTRVTYKNDEGDWVYDYVEDYTILRDRMEELLSGVSVYITEQEEILIGPSEKD